jgi:hypothetical protein
VRRARGQNGALGAALRLGRVGNLPELSDVSTDAQRPGPRPRLVGSLADLGYVLGMDTGADKLFAVVADVDGHVVASERRRAIRPRRCGRGAKGGLRDR